MANCPRCGEGVPLRQERIGAVVLDGCDACGGIWFDADELRQVIRSGGSGSGSAEAEYVPGPAGAPAAREDASCPRCGVALYEFSYPHSPEIKLDACPQCKGIWVDDGELAALAARFTPARPAATGAQPEASTPTLPTSRRRRLRHVVSLIQKFPCQDCGVENYVGAPTCWGCGAVLQDRRGAMLCPRCDNPLSSRTASGCGIALDADPAVDHCSTCGGIWMDTGALSLLMDVSQQWLNAWERQLSSAIRMPDTDREGEIVCPVDHTEMDSRAYAEDGSCYVDRCRICEGIWLDHGELTTLRRIFTDKDVWSRAT